MKNIIYIIGKQFILIFVLFALTLRFDFGYFLFIILLAGLGLSLLLTKHNQAVFNKKQSSRLFVVASYLFISFLFWNVIFIQHFFTTNTSVVHTMTWENKGRKNYTGESELIFKFTNYPGYFEKSYSNMLADDLGRQTPKNIDVTFKVTRFFGCWNGYNGVKIGTLDISGFTGGGYSGNGGPNLSSPWDEFYGKWWCPAP